MIIHLQTERERRKAELARKWSREYQTHIGQHAGEAMTAQQEAATTERWRSWMLERWRASEAF